MNGFLQKGVSKMIDNIVKAAREAGSILLSKADEGVEISRKSGHELVTSADILTEQFLKGRLLEIEPGAAFLGEESWNGVLPQPPFWIVDPLDGTNNYAHGYPVWAVSIAYWNGVRIEHGCIHDPTRDETFCASAGSGATLNGRRIHAAVPEKLRDCIFATGFPYHRREDEVGLDLKVLEYFLGRIQGIRRGGSAALDLAYVACGRLDGFWEEHLKSWDMAAGSILVTESGGAVTAYEGGKWSPDSGGIIASGVPVHSEMLRVIQQR